MVVLEDERDMLHEFGFGDGAHVRAADQHRSGLRVPEPGHQAGGRGLAGARGADQRHGGALRHGEAQVVKRGLLRSLVGEGHVTEFHAVVLRLAGVRGVGLRQRLGGEDAVQAAHRVVRLHEGLRGVHDLGHHRHRDGAEQAVEQEVGQESAEIAGVRGDDDRQGHQQGEGAVDGHQLRDLRRLAELRVAERHLPVFVDGLVEHAEGVHGLLEGLDHGDAAHVFDGRLVHGVERLLVAAHEVRAGAGAHHDAHEHGREDGRDDAGDARAPVEDEGDDDERHRRGDRAGQIRQAVRHHGVRLLNRPVDDAARLAAGVRIEPAERQAHHMAHAGLADVRGGAERAQVGARQSEEVDDERRGSEAHGPPGVTADVDRAAPVWGHGQQVAHHEPDADEHQHVQHRMHRGQHATEYGQRLVWTGVVQQLRDRGSLFGFALLVRRRLFRGRTGIRHCVPFSPPSMAIGMRDCAVIHGYALATVLTNFMKNKTVLFPEKRL